MAEQKELTEEERKRLKVELAALLSTLLDKEEEDGTE